MLEEILEISLALLATHFSFSSLNNILSIWTSECVFQKAVSVLIIRNSLVRGEQVGDAVPIPLLEEQSKPDVTVSSPGLFGKPMWELAMETMIWYCKKDKGPPSGPEWARACAKTLFPGVRALAAAPNAYGFPDTLETQQESLPHSPHPNPHPPRGSPCPELFSRSGVTFLFRDCSF